MRNPAIPETGPKRKLLDAAEQLFADKGFDAVSVRDITKLAGANVAAVNYHFGSREGLLTLVMTRYLTPVNQQRLEMLDAAEKRANGNPVPVEELLEAMCRPLISQVTQSHLSEKVYCKLLGRVMSAQDRDLSLAMEEQMRPCAHRLHAALEKTFPDVPREEMVWRLHFVHGAMVHLLHNQAMFRRLGKIEEEPLEVSFQRFLKFAVAGMCQNQPRAEESKKSSPQSSFNF